MKKYTKTSAEAADLRRRAESRLKERKKAEAAGPRTAEETQRLVHELQVHQVELEMQNEELREARADVEAGLERYRDLYDFAPVGYFTLHRDGTIRQANLTGARLLGTDGPALVNRRLGLFVSEGSRPAFNAFLDKVFASRGKETCEVAIRREGPDLLWAHIEARATEDGQACRVIMVDITERKRAEDALRESKDFEQAILDSVASHIVVLDRNGVIVAVNEPWRRFVLENPDEDAQPAQRTEVGVNYLDICRESVGLASEGAMAAHDGIRAVLDGRLPSFTLEYACHSPTQERWFTMTATPLGAPGRGAVISHVNITERKRAEEALREFKKAVEQCADGIALCDLVGHVRFVNAAWARMHGYSADELIGQHLAIFHTQEQLETEVNPFNRRLLDAGSQEAEIGHARKDGTTFPAQMTATVLTGADGRPFGLLGIARDITEQKRTQEALRETNQYLDNLLDYANAPIIVWDPQFRITRFNHAFESLTGRRADEVIGESIEILFPPTLVESSMERIKATLSGGRWEAVEIGILHRDGSVRTLLWNSATISAPDGKTPVATIAQGHDITERKRAEEELRVANTRLEKAVAQAEELAVKAEAASRAKSEFLANMSHEIRTPMTAILGYSDLLVAHNVPYQEQREFLTGIQRNGKALLDLISDILDLSRIEADRLTLEKTDCPLRQVIDDVLSVVQVRADEKGLSLDVDYAFPLPETIHTDPVRLRQILTNLIGNAVKFTQRGAVAIRVSATLPSPFGRGTARDHDLATSPHPSPLPEREGTVTVQFAVSDTGIGIPADKIDDLFRPFTQVDGTSTRRYGGTGLGLAISKRLAHALGGKVEVASKLGEGSTFTLTIDAGPLEGVRMLSAPQVSSTAEEKRSSMEREAPLHGRVLLAEDVPDVHVVLSQILKKMSLDVETAEDGRLACEMAEESKAEGRPYDLILMDIQMPGMSGYEATRWLRQRGWKGPIVALTAHALAGDREKCLEAGCDEYMAKPITAAGLRSILARYLGQAPAAEQPPTSAPQPVRESAGLLDCGLLDPDKVAALLDAFRGELPARAQRIDAAFQHRDRTLLSQLAHQLKGSAGLYGFDGISETARTTCDRLRAGDGLEELQAAVSELVALCRKAAGRPRAPSGKRENP